MYALVSLFAILSMTGLVEGLRGEKRAWWWLHGLANAGLLASHYFTVFLLPVQALAVLLWERRLSRRFLRYVMFQGALMAALVAWVANIPRQAEDLYSYYSMPSATMVANHLLARDSVTVSAAAFFPSSQAWNWLPGAAGNAIRGMHRYFDLALMGLSLFAFLAAAAGVVYHSRHGNKQRSWNWVLLLLWAFLPTALMVGVSWFWQPLYGSRYVMYSSVALYLIFGGLAAYLHGQTVYRVALMFLTVLYGYQLALAFPPETRTAWRQTLEKIRAESARDPVLLLEDPFWLPVLQWNEDKQVPVPTAAAFQRSTLCKAADFLNNLNGKTGEVWVLLVLTTDFDETPFVQCLMESSLFYDRYFYPGERKLALYRIHERKQNGEPTADDTPRKNLFAPLMPLLLQSANTGTGAAFFQRMRYVPDEKGGFWLRLGAALAAQGREETADAVFRHALATNSTAAYELLKFARENQVTLDGEEFVASMLRNTATPDAACGNIRGLLQHLFYEKDCSLLEYLGHTAINVAPQCPEGHVFLGLAGYQRGTYPEAVEHFRQAHELNPRIAPESAEAYGISLTETGAYEEAVSLFREALEFWPDFNWLHMRLGIVYAEMGRHVEAVEELRRALAPVPDDFYITYLLMQSLLALQKYDQALPLAQLPAIVERRELWVHLARWRVFVGAGLHEEAEKALKLFVSIAPDFEELYTTLYRSPDPRAAQRLLEGARKENDPLANELALAVAHLEKRTP